MPTFRQASFAGGEISPTLYGRTELAKYAVSLARCRNFIVEPQGCVSNRPGTVFVRAARGATVRLIPFIYSSDQSYVLEFGDRYIRFHTQGETVIEPVDGLTPWRIGVPYAIDALVSYSGHAYRCIADVDATIFPPTDSRVAGHWEVDPPLEVATPYAPADVRRLKYAQSGDVMTIVHPNYPPYELSRLSHTSWTLTRWTTMRTVDPPAIPPSPIVSGDQTGDDTHPTKEWQWVVTAWAGSEQSLHSDPITPGSTPDWIPLHAYAVNDTCKVTIGGVSRTYKCFHAGTSGTTTDWSVTLGLYTDGTVAWKYLGGASGKIAVYSDRPATIQFCPVDGATSYDIYRGRNGVFGYIGSASPGNAKSSDVGTFILFNDDGQVPDYETPPPEARNPFGELIAWASNTDYVVWDRVTHSGNTYECVVSGTSATAGPAGTESIITDGTTAWRYIQTGYALTNYPSVVAYQERRLVLSNTTSAPGTTWMSRIAQYHDFDTADPPLDDDSINFPISSRRREEIRNLVSGRALLMLTSEAERAVSGGNGPGDPITPSSITDAPHSQNGSSWVDPATIDGACVFVQERGNIVRDLQFDIGVEAYKGNDLTVLSRHLFTGRELVASCYARLPWSVAWFVRDDGVLLGLTYVREHDLWAWHWHDTAGAFADTCSVPEGASDAVYTAVTRTINGADVLMIERFDDRDLSDPALSAFSDAALKFDGTGVGNVTLTGTTSTEGSLVTVTSESSVLKSSDSGAILRLTSPEATARIKVTDVSGIPNSIAGVLLLDCPSTILGLTTADWARQFGSFSGLGHLEGESVSVLADGGSGGTAVVTSGTVLLDHPAEKAVIGLPYTPELQTLDLLSQGGEPRGHAQVLQFVYLELLNARGLWVGSSFDDLTPVKDRQGETFSIAPGMTTDIVKAYPSSSWGAHAFLCVQLRDPLPVTLLAVNREVKIGGN